MDNNALHTMLQIDLYNEYEHMMTYLRAASAVEGLHREELREFFMEEAHEELNHCHEFADMISYLGGEPVLGPRPQLFWSASPHNPHELLQRVVEMEQEVADNYARRLVATEPNAENCNAATAAIHVFYEEQIAHSQKAAWEVKKWLTRFPIPVVMA